MHTQNQEHIKILGIDPGSITCGYGLITKHNTDIRYTASGRIILPAQKPLHIRLKELYAALMDIISEYRPNEIVVEQIFFAQNAKSALSLGHARGVVLLVASLSGLPIYEYSALKAKKAVVGYGMADKTQVQKMVKTILNINYTLTHDSADALALAICHANEMGAFRGIIS